MIWIKKRFPDGSFGIELQTELDEAGVDKILLTLKMIFK